MKFSSRLLFGLLMSSLYFRGSNVEVFASQSLPNITVNEGESALITCCWNKTTEANKSLKVVWYKDEKRIPEEKRLNQISLDENCSVLNIINTVKNDTGGYVCKGIQDIPVLIEHEGNKTMLYINEGQNQAQTTAQGSSGPLQTTTASVTNAPNALPILPISLGSVFGLLTICLAFSFCKIRNSCKKTERRVIHQTPHSEGEEHEHMEEEEGSTGSSRGSLQWYQVPVYWSYFDLRRGEEQ